MTRAAQAPDVVVSWIRLAWLTVAVALSAPILDCAAAVDEDEKEEAKPAVAASPTLHFIDIGEGQCTLIDWGDIEILIDGGQHAAVLREYLDYTKIIKPPIELIVATHGDLDAFGGLAAVLDRKAFSGAGALGPAASWLAPYNDRSWEPVPVTEIWAPGDLRPARAGETQPVEFGSRNYARFLSSIRTQPEIALRQPFSRFHSPALASGRPVWFSLAHIPGVEFCVLNSCTPPDSPSRVRNDSVTRNDASIVALIRVGPTTIFVGGGVNGADPSGASVGVEARLLKLEATNPGTLKADVLLGPRNGSSSASSLAYIKKINPALVLFGTSATFDHPRSEIVERYRAAGVRVAITDLHRAGGRDHIVVDLGASNVPHRFGAGPAGEWIGRDHEGRMVRRASVITRLRRASRPDARLGERESWNDLRGWDLSRIDLAGQVLDGFDLSGTDLRGANLRGASLQSAILKSVQLDGCDLTGARLKDADLSAASARRTILVEADLQNAVLAGANLSDADLRRARLVESSLERTSLAGADLRGLIFEPSNLAVANPRDLWRSPHVAQMDYASSPHALIELRNAVWEAGFEQTGRAITFVIERGRTRNSGVFERWLRRVLFEWPVGYGRDPERPVFLVLGLIVLLALPYAMAVRPRSRDLVFRVPTGSPVGIPGELTAAEAVHERGLRLGCFALYFSFVSAFHIGWRELNVGSWALRLQPREYLLNSRGWVRVLSGVQSLLSVYLFALAIISTFGRLFT